MSLETICYLCKIDDPQNLQDQETGKWTCPRCDGRILPVLKVIPGDSPAVPTKVEWFTMKDSSGQIRVIDAKIKAEYEKANRKDRRKFEAGRLKNFPLLPKQLGTAHATRKKRTGSGE